MRVFLAILALIAYVCFVIAIVGILFNGGLTSFESGVLLCLFFIALSMPSSNDN